MTKNSDIKKRDPAKYKLNAFTNLVFSVIIYFSCPLIPTLIS